MRSYVRCIYYTLFFNIVKSAFVIFTNIHFIVRFYLYFIYILSLFVPYSVKSYLYEKCIRKISKRT